MYFFYFLTVYICYKNEEEKTIHLVVKVYL